MVGSFEVIIGPMFSGKTEELIRRLRRYEIGKRRTHLFAPSNSRGRYGSEDEWRSLGGLRYRNVSFIPANNEGVREMMEETARNGYEVVGIDEVQFFTLEEEMSIMEAIRALNGAGVDVIAAGLNMDFRGEPFGGMGQLIAIADKVTQLTAVCDICGREAYYTQRLINGEPAPYDSPLVLIGSRETYQARCKEHHLVPNAKANRYEGLFRNRQAR
ncbi:thymidine kinase [Thermocladium modestius]|uniref:Thymidine kinase n=1 Tax=Thermocladium modestius TaxID=62609 RepID=A0A830GXZ4_9CREN|nr:thymidine kinase [Thermocladium modestius]GGP21536.1 thymidine kinase [Thermocladium modestius]